MKRLLACATAVTVALAGVTVAVANEDIGGEIWFKKPRDFATGAVPSAEAFNRAAGDQLALQLAHAPLSDSIALGDFDHDGKADVAQTNVIAGSVSVFRGNGEGSFAAPHVLHVGMHPTFVVAGHLDLDDHLDLAVADFGSGDVAVLRGDGRGGFGLAQLVPVPTPRNVAIGDFNGDDTPDLAVAFGAPECRGTFAGCSGMESPPGGVAVLTGSAAPDERVTFTLTQVLRPTRRDSDQPAIANYVAVGDFDRSGFDDLAVAIGTSRSAGDREPGTGRLTGDDVLVHLNRNDPTGEPFGASPSQPARRVGGTPEAVAVGDWNGDGHPDLAVLGNGSGDVTTLIGSAAGHFTVKARNATVGTTPRSLKVADFNGDGIADLVTASFSSGTIGVLRGRGDGTFRPAIDFWAGEAPTAVDVGHLDGDRRVDVVVARTRTDELSLLVNDSPRRGDGVVITRDIPYIASEGDPFAAHHTLDVYEPPEGTASFAGAGRRYPVLLFIHGGAGISNNKTMYSYLLRSVAREGIVAVSINYRLGHDLGDAPAEDVATALRWTHARIGSKSFAGDPNKIIVFGYSTGAELAAKVMTNPAFADVRTTTRGLVLAAAFRESLAAVLSDGSTAPLPPSLLLSGTEGLEIATAAFSVATSEALKHRGAESTHVLVAGRDHLTLVANLALPGDPGRVAIFDFMRAVSAGR